MPNALGRHRAFATQLVRLKQQCVALQAEYQDLMTGRLEASKQTLPIIEQQLNELILAVNAAIAAG